MATKPKALRLSQYGSMTQIVYGCRNCEVAFFYDNNELYCHNCGTKQDWEGVLLYAPEHVSNLYHHGGDIKDVTEIRKKQNEIMEIIDEFNKGKYLEVRDKEEK